MGYKGSGPQVMVLRNREIPAQFVPRTSTPNQGFRLWGSRFRVGVQG